MSQDSHVASSYVTHGEVILSSFSAEYDRVLLTPYELICTIRTIFVASEEFF